MNEELEKVRKIFADDKFATLNGAVIDKIGDKYALCSIKIESRHRNALGAVMGGVYFTLADFAFAVASNHIKQGTVSLSSNITYLRSAKGNSISAEAVCVRSGKSTCYYKIDVFDEDGTQVAAVTTTGYTVA